MKNLKKLIALALSLVTVLALFAGCGGGEKVVVYNWGDYIDPEVIDMFEEETGIRVVYELFETNESMYTKLKNSNNNYDVIIPSDYMIERLIKEGFDVYICTASLFDTIKAKFEYTIGRYFPYISWNKIIVTKNKQLINGDILIDDGIHNLEGGRYRKILMSAPHNLSYDAASNGMTRVTTWRDAYSAVRSYALEITEEESVNNNE